MGHGWFFEIIGKIVYAGLDCDGNIHLVLRKESGFWRDVAVRFLKGEENHIVKLRIMPWNHRRVNERFKRPHKSTIAVRNGETQKREWEAEEDTGIRGRELLQADRARHGEAWNED